MTNNSLNDIRNFTIIAHIDHGKSTLADRLIEKCSLIKLRHVTDQMLDSMSIERERGITIKSQTVLLKYQSAKYGSVIFNVIDTPGHVDFSYEVSRSLMACEGSVLVIDATQGVEAQTLANLYKAIDSGHEILPVFNKVDLPSANVAQVKQQLEDILCQSLPHSVEISAKTGFGLDTLLEKMVEVLPAPTGDIHSPLKALVIDSWYNNYLGIIVLIRVKNGFIKAGMRIKMLSTGCVYEVNQVGVFLPHMHIRSKLEAGEVGFCTASIKNLEETRIGDTIAEDYKNNPVQPFPGFHKSVPMVFCGMFTSDSTNFEEAKKCMAKLQLNDPSFFYTVERSNAFGMGFRCGFLGLLHMEIIRERLYREFKMQTITTAPSVLYKIHLKNDKELEVSNPLDMPHVSEISTLQEPWAKVTIITPPQYIGNIFTLLSDRRGIQQEVTYTQNSIILIYDIPLSELINDFYDCLKSSSQGYASFDYETTDYRLGKIIKLDILLNGEPADALSQIIHESHAVSAGRTICQQLKAHIPRHQFKVIIQAAIGSKIIARETISPYRKDVTAKCYGGDVTRKRKLLEKQKQGKSKLKSVGQVKLPQNIFQIMVPKN